ncbi:hypothetical protein AMTRI_Chr06g176710 [Amborella trichopoda]
MNPNPKAYPVLSYVMGQSSNQAISGDSDTVQVEIQGSDTNVEEQMPNLKNPKMLASMTDSVSNVAQARKVLEGLGERPDHETLDMAHAKIEEIDSKLSKQLEEIVLAPQPEGVEQMEWRAQQAQKEKQCRQAAEKEKYPFKAIIQLDEMHEAYEQLLRNEEVKLVKMYESAEENSEFLPAKDEVNEEVINILQEASHKNVEKVVLSGRLLRFLPEAFGRLRNLVILDLSSNQLEVIPDSIAGLEKLEELYLSSNQLVSLPDSIGLLLTLKILDVSANKLKALPDSIAYCRSLVELDASFNQLTFLPTNIGYELVNLQRLSVHLNKIRSLPSSVSEMRSLRHLDLHFNELRSLPQSIGRLANLEYLNLSSNFSDLTGLPLTIGDLTNLKELDLSNNQIHALPDTFGRLEKLTKLNLDQNPLVIPPMEIVNQGVEAVKEYMAKRWLDILLEEERKSMVQENNQAQTGWLIRSTSWLNNFVHGITGNVAEYLGTEGKSPRDPYLDQQL